jgi:cytochrome c553
MADKPVFLALCQERAHSRLENTPMRINTLSLRCPRRLALLMWPIFLAWMALPVAHASGSLAQTQCAVCHGPQGQSTDAQFPQLAAQNADYLRKQLQDFQAGRRSNPIMTPMALSLTPAQIDELALYFSLQPGTPHPGDDELLAQVGRYIYERGNIYSKVPACRSCHGDAGAGNARLPRLAGQQPDYVEKQLLRFQHKERQNDSGVMGFVTEGLTPLEMRAVAAYIGQMQPVASSAKAKKK